MKSKDISRRKEAKHAALQQQAAKTPDPELMRALRSMCNCGL